MVDCVSLILAGDILGGIVCPYSNMIGPWFYAFIIGIVELAVYMKYDNLLAPGMIGVVCSLLMFGLLPGTIWFIPFAIFAGNMAAILYELFTKSNW
jgi:hypothetical protein